MKQTKKIVSILLTLVMVFAMAIPAFATQEGEKTGGSITINNAVKGQTYSAYQIMYLESYDAAAGAYSYKANTAWESWLKNQTTYVTIDDKGYVTWVEGADAAAFAKLAQTEAVRMVNETKDSENKYTEDATATAESTSVKFENLKLGYYLVDTSLGALCSLNTTNPNVTMEEKNGQPNIEKQVKEDSTDEWGNKNTAQIGDTVEFKSTVLAKKGAQNYIVHDQMSEGLTLNENSIEVKVGTTPLTKDTDYTVEFNVSCKDKDGNSTDCDFHIIFKQAYLDEITTDTTIVITYSAVLNKDAKISTDVNKNKTKLDYGDKLEGEEGEKDNSTEWSETETETFKFDLVKTDIENKLLAGAEFELYTGNSEDSRTKVSLVKVSDNTYRIADNTDTENLTTKITTIATEKICIIGIDVDKVQKYWLKEIKAPDGYNVLSDFIPVNMHKDNKPTNNIATMDDSKTVWVEGGVHVINKTGAELPSTGGIGTTIFYALGIMLAAGAAIVLVVRRRMRTE